MEHDTSKSQNHTLKNVHDSEVDKISNIELKRMMVRMSSEIKEDMFNQLNKFKENKNKQLNEFKEDKHKQLNKIRMTMQYI
jgi:uncharacterized Fe-S cluster-containing protein